MSGPTEVTDDARRQAMHRYEVLRPHLEDGVPLAQAARDAGVAVRTAERWLSRYRADGLAGLARSPRTPTGRRLDPNLVSLIEDLALRKPRPSIASIHRRAENIAHQQGWNPSSYSTVYSIVAGLDPAMLTLAHEGATALRDRYELVYRRSADHPNEIWQADHTELDTEILDPGGRPAPPWLTVVLDDHSRAVPGYTVGLDAPSALRTSLALRQAIWTKSDPTWPMCGIPEVLYVDHGSDFTSDHLRQVAADLKFQLVHSAVARPQGRSKIDRFFGTVTTELLPDLDGHLLHGRPTSPPTLTLSDLDHAIGEFITGTYHQCEHSETGASPQRAWTAQGWLPRMPDSLEHLDLLLVEVAKPRVIRRDGIHFQDCATRPAARRVRPRARHHPLPPPRHHRDPRLPPRPVPLQGRQPRTRRETISLKDIDAARRAHRRHLRAQINERISVVADYLPNRHTTRADPQPAS